MWDFIQSYWLIFVLLAIFIFALTRGGDDLDVESGHRHGAGPARDRHERDDPDFTPVRRTGGCH